MSELRKAAEQALDVLAAESVGELVNASEVNDLISRLEAALAQPEQEALQEVERLRAALRYEENRFSRIGTHGPDCWKWGPGHYECALRHIKEIPHG